MYFSRSSINGKGYNILLAEDAASAMNPTQKKYSKFELANTLTGHNIKIANIIWFACFQPDTVNTDFSYPIKNAKMDIFR